MEKLFQQYQYCQNTYLVNLVDIFKCQPFQANTCSRLLWTSIGKEGFVDINWVYVYMYIVHNIMYFWRKVNDTKAFLLKCSCTWIIDISEFVSNQDFKSNDKGWTWPYRVYVTFLDFGYPKSRLEFEIRIRSLKSIFSKTQMSGFRRNPVFDDIPTTYWTFLKKKITPATWEPHALLPWHTVPSY